MGQLKERPYYRDYDEPRYYGAPATTRRAGIIAPDGLEPGMGASRAGRSKTAFVNLTGAVKRQLNTEKRPAEASLSFTDTHVSLSGVRQV